jgi:hypothetical protein
MMRIQMESTAIIVTVQGVKCRVWNGVTEDGVQCFAFVACLAFRADHPPTGIEAELIEMDAPILDESELRGGV